VFAILSSRARKDPGAAVGGFLQARELDLSVLEEEKPLSRRSFLFHKGLLLKITVTASIAFAAISVVLLLMGYYPLIPAFAVITFFVPAILFWARRYVSLLESLIPGPRTVAEFDFGEAGGGRMEVMRDRERGRKGSSARGSR
jgi:hypothetical protein